VGAKGNARELPPVFLTSDHALKERPPGGALFIAQPENRMQKRNLGRTIPQISFILNMDEKGGISCGRLQQFCEKPGSDPYSKEDEHGRVF